MTHLALQSMPTKLTLWVTAVALVCMPMLSCGPAASIEAQAAVEESCSKIGAVTDLDVTTQMVSYDPEEDPPTTTNAVFEVEVSGNDWQVFMTFRDEDGLLLGTIEARKVGEQSYYREDGGTWRTDLPIGGLGFPYAAESQCPALGPVAKVGEEDIDGVPATHYAFSAGEGVGHVGAVDEYGTDYGDVTKDDWDVWIDDSGTLLQTKQVMVVGLEDNLEHVTTLTTKFSGIGEANTITAPTIP